MYNITAQVVPVYNNLMDVHDADITLLSQDKDLIIDSLLDVIRQFGMQNAVGLRLLHKHNLISETELMVEYVMDDDNGFALVTKATSMSEIDENSIVPNSWALSDEGFIPIEFSRKELVKNPTINPRGSNKFFQALGSKLRELGVSSTIGPALIQSELVSMNRIDGCDLMLEFTAIDDRANVLRYVSKDQCTKSTIETFWCSSDDSSEAIKKCVKICPSVQNPPVHQGTSIHQQK